MKKIPDTARFFILILCVTFFSFLSKFSIALTTITNTQFIQDGQDAETLVSEGEIFELGFFNPSKSTKNRYLGMWYKRISTQTVVWVANREKPLNDSTGILKMSDDGNLVLIDGSSGVLWSTNISKVGHPVVQLTESGNLVLKEESDGTILWQSFDHPSDTLLPGMKLGWDLKTGLNRFLTSWKSADDPSPGDFTFKLDLHGYPEPFLSHGSEIQYRSGPWNGIRFSGVPEMSSYKIFRFEFMDNQEEIYYSFQVLDSSYVSRLVVNSSGQLQRFTSLDQEDESWNMFWWEPKDQCDNYNACGPYGICNTDDSPVCSCAHGFQPNSPEEWFLRDASGGCVRRKPLNCPSGDGFLRLEGMKLPDTTNAFVDKSMSIEKCKHECLNACSCTAYSSANISSGEGSGCIIWSGDLIDLRQFTKSGQELYVRLAASELGENDGKKRLVAILIPTVAAGILLLGVFCCFLRRRFKAIVPRTDGIGNSPNTLGNGENISELPLFSFHSIAAATDNFSTTNKLGQGGFGPVYKCKLADGKVVAVKRLSKSSGQGLEEFKNEVRLIAKLQHRNLVKLLGCCIHGDEKILVYEFMPNKSLDKFIFEPIQDSPIDWTARFRIIEGIAQGLLYLHRHSRFKIIHRDLKTSNILLDGEMNPKISDFGLARIVEGNQSKINTIKVAGTYGYLSPEYAMNGTFSEKSDVFSFGVLLLEIVSGQRNTSFYPRKQWLSLLSYVWQLWEEDRALEVVDPLISNSYKPQEVMKCIHIGLLCVQEYPNDRPTMSSVVLMLGSDNATLPAPKQPAFSSMKDLAALGQASDASSNFSPNWVTLTTIEAK